MRARGGRGKHIQICLCLAQSIFFELPSNSLEATEFRTTTKRGYGSASVAVRAEKRAIKNVKIIVLFSETETANQNQKFPFHFFFRFATEGWGEEAQGKCKEIFWFLHTRVRERVRGAHHWSSGFNSKYIRTSFNTHRQKSFKYEY